MSSEVETSLIIVQGHFKIALQTVRDGKPGLADYVGCVTASTTLGMTNGWPAPMQHCAAATA
jgi:hypothetical protein